MRFRKAEDNVSELNMTPMIDMTFQLISFFMFVINFNNDLIEEQVTLPMAEIAHPVEGPTVRPLFLNISKEGRLILMGGEELSVNDPAEMGKIHQYLRKESAIIKFEMSQAGKDFSTGLESTVIIRADERVEYGVVQDIIRATREAGFVNFSLRALIERK